MSAPSINPPPQHQASFPLRCDCCKNPISDGIHAQNNPCGHNICIPCVLGANMKRGANPGFCQVRDCSQQFITSCQYFNRGVPGEMIENEVAIIDKVCTDSDVLTDVFAYLVPKEI